nr:MAG TPA: hypothetical protein [Caudoviricetes sp.]DAV53785.1 MAG TPA: hypothetical protein [Caudoviricetes sp.]
MRRSDHGGISKTENAPENPCAWIELWCICTSINRL